NAELHMLLWTLGVFFLMGMLTSLVFVLAPQDTVIISVVMGIVCAFLPGSLVATCVAMIVYTQTRSVTENVVINHNDEAQMFSTKITWDTLLATIGIILGLLVGLPTIAGLISFFIEYASVSLSMDVVGTMVNDILAGLGTIFMLILFSIPFWLTAGLLVSIGTGWYMRRLRKWETKYHSNPKLKRQQTG
ncbi:MAG: hypothetical protein AAFN11_19765, partial [Chloroflexota bacterium]